MDCTQARTRGYIITLGTVSGMVGLIAYRRDVLRPSVPYSIQGYHGGRNDRVFG
jgi:hypothetical protein